MVCVLTGRFRGRKKEGAELCSVPPRLDSEIPLRLVPGVQCAQGLESLEDDCVTNGE